LAQIRATFPEIQTFFKGTVFHWRTLYLKMQKAKTIKQMPTLTNTDLVNKTLQNNDNTKSGSMQ